VAEVCLCDVALRNSNGLPPAALPHFLNVVDEVRFELLCGVLVLLGLPIWRFFNAAEELAG